MDLIKKVSIKRGINMKNTNIFIFMVLNIVAFSSIKDENEIKKYEDLNESKIIKERGIERLNFYIPVSENNKINTFVEIENRPNKNINKWTIGEGYINLNERWDFNYKIGREFHEENRDTNRKYNVWDNEISFVRLNKGFKIGEKNWNYRTLFGIKHTENNILSAEKDYTYKYYIGQKISTFLPKLGMGGTYFELESLANRLDAKEKKGYSIQTALKSNSILGYGFQWSNILETEYIKYSRNKGRIRGKIESIFKWTYELGKNFAFSPELSIKTEKYFYDNEENYTLESNIGPYFLYSKNITERLRISGKLGYFYKYDSSKYGNTKNSESNFSKYAKMELEYIF